MAEIAEAAEVSESTFFRYFPTKEDVVLWDELDPLIIERFQSQAPGVGPITALRTALREVFGALPAGAEAEMRQRGLVMLSAPPLRARLLDQVAGPFALLVELFAQRMGRRPDEMAVRALAGAALGVGFAGMFIALDDPQADLAQLFDSLLAQLEPAQP